MTANSVHIAAHLTAVPGPSSGVAASCGLLLCDLAGWRYRRGGAARRPAAGEPRA